MPWQQGSQGEAAAACLPAHPVDVPLSAQQLQVHRPRPATCRQLAAPVRFIQPLPCALQEGPSLRCALCVAGLRAVESILGTRMSHERREYYVKFKEASYRWAGERSVYISPWK